MTALELVKNNIVNSGLDSSDTNGFHSTVIANDLDCDCVDGDCSIGGYEW